jgi:hypothetical protein
MISRFSRQLLPRLRWRKDPEQPFVLDHLAKPLIKDGSPPWRNKPTTGEVSNVSAQDLRLVTSDWRNWRGDDFKPYLDVVRGFGPDRLMLALIGRVFAGRVIRE